MNRELERALQAVAGSRVLLVACDFDGTLSPIVPDPASASPDPRALAPLCRLAAIPRTHALVISGRSREDLRARLGAHPALSLVGSHGAEMAGTELPVTAADVGRYLEVLEPVARRFEGAVLETKPLSVAFHYRRVPSGQQERARAEALAAARDRAEEIRDGKKVVEFMALRADKGSALIRCRRELGATAVVFLGDDVTDEAAFRALAPDDVGVKVGPEPTAATHRVVAREEVARVLTRLADLRSERTGG